MPLFKLVKTSFPLLRLLLRYFFILLDFSSSIINDMLWYGFFLIVFCSVSFLNIQILFFSNLEILLPLSFQLFFSVSLSFWDDNYTIFRLPLIFSQVFDALFFISFFAFYFHIFNLRIFFPCTVEFVVRYFQFQFSCSAMSDSL